MNYLELNENAFNAEMKRLKDIKNSQIPNHKIGDVVVLNSGGPDMTVIKSTLEFEYQAYSDSFDETKFVETLAVRYLNHNGEFSTADFDSRCVNKVTR